MLPIIGILVVFGMVFGSYSLTGGSIGVLLEALPGELATIGGASTGAFLIANKFSTIKRAISDFGKTVKGTKWHKKDYIDLLCLLFLLTKIIRSKGVLAIEQHIENPTESTLFNQFPKILGDRLATHLICDTLRVITMNLEDPYQIEDNVQKQIDRYTHEVLAGADALQSTADALPAYGIVSAVLGVIKTMAHIDQPPAVLGGMIAGALFGTFLGVFIGYCFVAPVASKARSVHMQDMQFLLIIRDVLVAHLKGNAPQVSVEIGRGNVPGAYQPTFFELEEAMQEMKTNNTDSSSSQE